MNFLGQAPKVKRRGFRFLFLRIQPFQKALPVEVEGRAGKERERRRESYGRHDYRSFPQIRFFHPLFLKTPRAPFSFLLAPAG